MTASAHFSARITSASPFRRARVAELQLQVGALLIVSSYTFFLFCHKLQVIFPLRTAASYYHHHHFLNYSF